MTDSTVDMTTNKQSDQMTTEASAEKTHTWNLDSLYKGLDDPTYQADLDHLDDLLKQAANLAGALSAGALSAEALSATALPAEEITTENSTEKIATENFAADTKQPQEQPQERPQEQAQEQAKQQEVTLVKAIRLLEDLMVTGYKVVNYPNLLAEADTTNTEYPSLLNRLMMALSGAEVLQVEVQGALAKVEDVDQFAERNGLAHYKFILGEHRDLARFKMDSRMEELAAKLNISGGSAWGKLQGFLTSTLEVDYEGQTITLSDVRNLAHDPNREVRRKAYESELKAYSKIEDSVAYALNSIKQQVTLLCRERGYESPLAEALQAARLDRETLDTMMGVMEKSFPDFRRYLRAKARLLGHEHPATNQPTTNQPATNQPTTDQPTTDQPTTDQLPFYDLFAPVGKIDAKFTVEEARDFLLEVFTPLSQDIADVMQRAFDEEWIDFLPRPGKAGGAFCENLPMIKESRILTNFDGSFDSISTLAHELGHAYHGSCIEDHAPLNWDYSMPVAETASTFNETHLTLQALDKTNDPQAKLALLENFLSGATQTIVDIYSRFLFEQEVFERCESEFMDSKALQDIMLRAQEKTYGDALAKAARHPYMWICKGHYYSSSLSYYNFPYAFGQLFSMGLYNLYRQEGAPFMAKYRDMLHETTVASCENVAAKVGVNLREPAFWEGAMAEFTAMISEYETLVETMQ